MAFTSSASAQTGVMKGASATRALSIVQGVWASDTGVTKGTITTGLSHVIAYGVNVDTGTVTSELKSKPNVDADGAASEGSIGILVCVQDNAGSWWAIGY